MTREKNISIDLAFHYTPRHKKERNLTYIYAWLSNRICFKTEESKWVGIVVFISRNTLFFYKNIVFPPEAEHS